MKIDLGWLIGSEVERLTYDEQRLQWLFTITRQASLAVACPWQVLAEDRVAPASSEHGQPYGLPPPGDLVPLAASPRSSPGKLSRTLGRHRTYEIGGT